MVSSGEKPPGGDKAPRGRRGAGGAGARPRKASAAEREELRRTQVALQRKKKMILIALAVAVIFLAWILLSPGRHPHSPAKPQPANSLVVPRRPSSVAVAASQLALHEPAHRRSSAGLA